MGIEEGFKAKEVLVARSPSIQAIRAVQVTQDRKTMPSLARSAALQLTVGVIVVRLYPPGGL